MSDPQPSQDELQRQLATLERTLAEWTAHGMPEAMLATVRQQVEEVRQQIATDRGAFVGTTVNTGGGDFIGRDNLRIEYNILDKYVPEELLPVYYRAIATECRRLPLGVIDTEFVNTSNEQAIPLPDIYVDLDVVAPALDRDVSERAWPVRLTRGEGGERIPLLEALARPAAAKTVLLGDAGSGKTTFVNYLAHLVLTADPVLPLSWRGLLPVRLILRDVAARCIPAEAQQGTPEMLWQALKCDMAAQLGSTAADTLLSYLQHQLLAKGGIFLLDGLDEVPQALQRRAVLGQAICALADLLKSTPSRLIVTARPYAYADRRWQLPEFAILKLAPFSDAQVQHFIGRWYAAVRPSMGWNMETSRDKANRLQVALQERSYLADLASRPLLLTLMATLHSSWGQLPEDRASLYEETIKLVLSRWQRARETRGLDGELVAEPGITQALSIGEDRVRDALEALAFRVHANKKLGAERNEDPAAISEGEVLVAFKPLLGELDPVTLLGYLKDCAGLLIAQSEDVYAFLHRSFQEYLAACHLANTEPDFALRLQSLVWEDPAWWSEVFLLGVGKKRRGGLSDALHVINALIPQEANDVERITEKHWHAAALAGQAILELQLIAESRQKPYCEALVKRVTRWLARLIESGQLTVRERAAAGDILGRLGDPRSGVGVIISPAKCMPDLVWIEVPAGPFVLGSEQIDDQAAIYEQPAHMVILPTYLISRYPITNAQYGPFVNDGYCDRDLWTPEGWAWREGAPPDLSVIDDSDYQQSYVKLLNSRPVERRDRPYWWGDYHWSAPTRPVVGISWFEAMAYCRWLAKQLACQGQAVKVWTSDGVKTYVQQRNSFVVHLPSEAEWEKAARGSQRFRWPWGNQWRDGLANTSEAGLNRTSPVGTFPEGASLYGVQDMVGNVWEWTRSKWGKRLSAPDYRYPYVPNDSREDPRGSDLRVVRGGSWAYGAKLARCTARAQLMPDVFFGYVGFRVLLYMSGTDS